MEVISKNGAFILIIITSMILLILFLNGNLFGPPKILRNIKNKKCIGLQTLCCKTVQQVKDNLSETPYNRLVRLKQSEINEYIDMYCSTD